MQQPGDLVTGHLEHGMVVPGTCCARKFLIFNNYLTLIFSCLFCILAGVLQPGDLVSGHLGHGVVVAGGWGRISSNCGTPSHMLYKVHKPGGYKGMLMEEQRKVCACVRACVRLCVCVCVCVCVKL